MQELPLHIFVLYYEVDNPEEEKLKLIYDLKPKKVGYEPT